MRISPSVWEQTQYGLVDDFLDLFLPSVYERAVEPDCPWSPVMRPMGEDLGASIEFPEARLLRLEQYWDEPSAETLEP